MAAPSLACTSGGTTKVRLPKVSALRSFWLRPLTEEVMEEPLVAARGPVAWFRVWPKAEARRCWMLSVRPAAWEMPVWGIRLGLRGAAAGAGAGGRAAAADVRRVWGEPASGGEPWGRGRPLLGKGGGGDISSRALR